MNALNQNLVEFELKPGVRVIVYNTQLTLGKKPLLSWLKDCCYIGSRICSFLHLLQLFWVSANQLFSICVWEISIYRLKAELVLCFPLKKERVADICDSGTKTQKYYQINSGLLAPHVNKLYFLFAKTLVALYSSSFSVPTLYLLLGCFH